MSISIHELLAVARESEGVKAVQGDDMLCEKRFAPDTRYMVEFLLLEQKEQFGEKGEYHRYFLTKEGACFRGNTALSSSPGIFPGPGVGSLTGWKEKNSCRSAPPDARTLSPEVFYRMTKKGVVGDDYWNRPRILCY